MVIEAWQETANCLSPFRGLRLLAQHFSAQRFSIAGDQPTTGPRDTLVECEEPRHLMQRSVNHQLSVCARSRQVADLANMISDADS